MKDLACTSSFAQDSLPAGLLRNGVRVVANRTSPCTMTLTLGQYSHQVCYTYPISERASNIRVARKSSYVELYSPIHFPNRSWGYHSCPFPVVVKDCEVAPWNMTNVDLQKLEDISVDQDTWWLALHLELAFSAEEVGMITSRRANTMINVRNSLHTIFLSFVGRYPLLKDRRMRAFRLID